MHNYRRLRNDRRSAKISLSFCWPYKKIENKKKSYFLVSVSQVIERYSSARKGFFLGCELLFLKFFVGEKKNSMHREKKPFSMCFRCHPLPSALPPRALRYFLLTRDYPVFFFLRIFLVWVKIRLFYKYAVCSSIVVERETESQFEVIYAHTDTDTSKKWTIVNSSWHSCHQTRFSFVVCISCCSVSESDEMAIV